MTVYVRAEEFACPCDACSQSNFVDPRLVDRLDYCRRYAAIPFVINSGWRCEHRNNAVGGSPHSAHLMGLAADISAKTSREKYLILKSLFHAGFNRIGVYPDFIHADISTANAQDVVWWHD